MWESTYQQELRASVLVDWTVDCTVAYPHGTRGLSAVTRVVAILLSKKNLGYVETVMGLCGLPRTVCERVGERWRDGAGSLAILGIRSLRCLHTRWRRRATRPIFDCRETVIGPRPRGRTVCERVGERRRDGAG